MASTPPRFPAGSDRRSPAAAAPASLDGDASAGAPAIDGADPTPSAAATTKQSGLATPAQIVELADQLSACADQIHERVMREIRAYAGGPVPDAVQTTARALLEDEVQLRQRANGLYADAATFIVKALGKPQSQLVQLTADAAEKIRWIGVIGQVTSLVGGLLSLAGAAATGQAVPVLMALEKIHKQVKAIEALAPKPPSRAR